MTVITAILHLKTNKKHACLIIMTKIEQMNFFIFFDK